MTRWKHAGRGPKVTLLVGILLGVASLALYNSAYAATLGEPPYPGSPALPGIPNGPKLGCSPTGTASETWVCGFNALSNATFEVNGQKAGSYQADSNGCVLLVLTFSLGSVEVNGNAPVKTRAGTNYLIIKGHKTTKTGTYVVGLRVAFEVPHGNARTCVTGPGTTTTTSSFSTTTSTSSSTTSTTLKRPRFPRFTTSTRNNPTTLAKVIETPLEISPNKVILETSLLAAVLAAILSAGALGSIWSSEGDGAPSDGEIPPPSGDAGAAAAGGTPDAPPEPPTSPAPGGPTGTGGSGEAVAPPASSAFSRTRLGPGTGGGGT